MVLVDYIGILFTCGNTFGHMLEYYSGSSQKQQSMGMYVTPLGHVILIPRQPVFVLSLLCCVLSADSININVIVFGLLSTETRTPDLPHSRLAR
jgi:hypothetical protein